MHSQDIRAKLKQAVSREFESDSSEDLFESSFQKASYKLLHNHLFEHVLSATIVLSLCFIVIETELTAKGEVAPLWVTVCYWLMLFVFMLESTLRLAALRSQFWRSPMNICELFVVCSDVGLSAKSLLDTDSGFIGVSLFRMLRLLRLLRATKAVAVFPELHLMMSGLHGACSSIFWGTVLLFFALIFWGVLAVWFIQPLNLQVAETGAYDGCDRCARAYETTWQAALTFTTQIVCGDSWARETVPIIEAFPITALFFMGVFLSVGMAVLNLILGVVVNAATEARDGLKQEMIEKKAMRTYDAKNRLLAICAEMDVDGSGELNLKEIQAGFDSNQEFKETISELGVHDKYDLEVVWAITDTEKDGAVSFTELVTQLYIMKSSEMDYLLAYVKFYVTQMQDKIAASISKAERDLELDISQAERGLELDISRAAMADGKSKGTTSLVGLAADTDTNTTATALTYEGSRLVTTSSPCKDSQKADMGQVPIEEKKVQGGDAVGEMASMSSEPLLSQLKLLQQQFSTSSENMQRAHAEMLETFFQRLPASIASAGAPSPYAAEQSYQKDAYPPLKKMRQKDVRPGSVTVLL